MDDLDWHLLVRDLEVQPEYKSIWTCGNICLGHIMTIEHTTREPLLDAFHVVHV